MRLQRLVVRDFRNLVDVALELGPRFTVLEGNNGQGKTAILEAIYVLASLKSFRAQRTEEIIRHGATAASLLGIIDHNELLRTVEVDLGVRRRIRIDGKPTRSIADSLGQLTVVLFAPEDLAITKSGPAHRRRFLDRAVFNRFPASLDAMRRYEVALRHRNALLRDGGTDSMLDVFDDQLATAAAEVIEWRHRTLEALVPAFQAAFSEVMANRHRTTLVYEPTTPAGADLLRAHLAGTRRDERRRGTTTTGPHLDDLAVGLDSHPARTTASQGQHRALVLALKVAEIRTLQTAFGYSPLLLLDDVSSELDAHRNADLMRYLRSDGFDGQIVITTTDRAHIRVSDDVRWFQVEDGRVGPATLGN